jgi:acetylornithine aminotransferase
LACAAGITTLDVMEQDNLLAHADTLGKFIRDGFAQQLQGVAGVVEIRGQGLMIGVELAKPCGELVKLALAKGLLINVTADSVVRLLPPLTMTTAEAQQLLDILCLLIQEFLQS